MQQTSARFPRPVLDRLQKFGVKGESYSDIVTNLMDSVERQRFVDELGDRIADRGRLIPHGRVPH